MFGNLVHDGAADDYRIAIGGDLSDLVGVGNPKPNGNRQVRVATNGGDAFIKGPRATAALEHQGRP